MFERFVPITRYEGMYDISNFGRVRSLDRFCRNRWGTQRPVKSRIMVIGQTKYGYKQILLAKEGKSVKFFIHRLVAIAFIENASDYPQVNHLDGDKSNNCATNLEWVTSQQNCHHALENKLYEVARGEATGHAKLTENAVRNIRTQVANGIYHKVLATQYGVGRKAITKIVNRQRWKHVV